MKFYMPITIALCLNTLIAMHEDLPLEAYKQEASDYIKDVCSPAQANKLDFPWAIKYLNERKQQKKRDKELRLMTPFLMSAAAIHAESLSYDEIAELMLGFAQKTSLLTVYMLRKRLGCYVKSGLLKPWEQEYSQPLRPVCHEEWAYLFKEFTKDNNANLDAMKLAIGKKFAEVALEEFKN